VRLLSLRLALPSCLRSAIITAPGQSSEIASCC